MINWIERYLGGSKMAEVLSKKQHKWTNIILVIVCFIIVGYIAYIRGWIPTQFGKSVELEEKKQLFELNSKEKSYVGINNKQIFHVSQDGIKAYDFEGTELWRDTFSFTDFIVVQKEPYIAVGTKRGTSIHVFNEKGKQAEIKSENPIVYFSVNEAGCVVAIANNDDQYTVTAYNEYGDGVCTYTTYVKDEGYPIVAELSPDNTKIVLSYVSVDEPQVVSRVYIIDVQEPEKKEKNTAKYGGEQKNNLVYEIEFINEDTWVTIGDELCVWYDLEGNELGKEENLSLVLVPYLYRRSQHGLGYLPVVLSDKPTQNIIRRQDKLVYFNHLGEKTFETTLEGGVKSVYADNNGTTIQLERSFFGYNKLGNLFFKYTANTDVNKVIYKPTIRKGIAVTKEGVYVLMPKKEIGKNG